jgi:MFS family permease
MGWSSSVLFIPFASDKIGRRWLFAATMMCTAGSMIGLYLSTNINLSIFFMFLTGMSTSGRTTVGYVLATEYFTPKYQVFFGTLFNFADGTTSLILTTYYAFISKHYLYCSMIGCCYAIICVIGMIFFAKESPLWLLKMGRISES